MNSILSWLPEGLLKAYDTFRYGSSQRTKLGRNSATSHRMSSMISIDAHPHRSLPDQAKLKISSRYSPGLKFRIPGDEPQFRGSRTTDGNLVLIGLLTSLNERRDGGLSDLADRNAILCGAFERFCTECCRAGSAIEIIWGSRVAHWER
jgi:hypothetical protein